MTLPVVAGAFAGWLIPRGPVTTPQALSSVALALVVGVAVGYLTGSRWSMLVAPLVYQLVFELVRLPTDGLTVDGIHVGGGLYGVLAFALGRVFPALLTLVPLWAGVVFGIALADHLDGEAAGRPGTAWLVSAGVMLLGLAWLAIVISRPAATAPILDSAGSALAGSVAELVDVPIGGHDQALLVRGRDVTNPVLLYLAGGPGGTDVGAMRRDVTLEQDFTVVTWDQRGAGKSYAALDPTDTLTVDRLVRDTVEVTDYLRQRFGHEKIYLVGQSWGSTLGVLTVQRHPELYHAFVGVGQMVSQRATDVMFWEDTIEWAAGTGAARLADRLRRNGAPPYVDVALYEPVVAYEHDWNAYPAFDVDNEMPAILMVPEYTFMDRINAFRGFLDSASVIYPQLQNLDFRVDATSLDVPVTVVLGEHEARGRAVPAREWFELLAAPSKRLVTFDGAGHRANFDSPGRFAELMREVRDGVDGSSLTAPLGSNPAGAR